MSPISGRKKKKKITLEQGFQTYKKSSVPLKNVIAISRIQKAFGII